MGKFDGILILSDLDGTLLNEACAVSKPNAEAIEYFKSEGGRFAVASGRHPKNIKTYFEDFSPNAPCICYNGGIIYDFDGEKVVMSRQLPKSVLGVAHRMAELFPDCSLAVETLECMNLIRDNDVTKMMLSLVACSPKYFDSFDEITDPWIKLSVWTRPEDSKMVEKVFAEEALPDGMRSIRTHACAVEVLSHETDKGFALDEYKKLVTGIKAFIALGDNENDNIMLQKADLSFTPSNANPMTAKISTEQLGVSCDEHFVKAAIERIEKAYI